MRDLGVKDLVKNYGEESALRGLSFSVSNGNIFGVVGPNGAGKSTLLKIIAGLIEPSSGEVFFDEKRRMEGFEERIGYLPEKSPVYEDMSAIEYLRFFGDLYGVEDECLDERIHGFLDDLDLEERELEMGKMSKGMKRKVMVARSLINGPELLIYDEPGSGLDPVTTNFLLDYVEELGGDEKIILISAHNLFHIESVCDRALILKDGVASAIGSIDEIKEDYGDVVYRVFSSDKYSDLDPVKSGKYWVYETRNLVEMREVMDYIEDMGGDVLDVRTKEVSLEDVFLEKVG